MHHFAHVGAARYFREVTAATQYLTLTDKQHVQASHTGFESHADDVQIVAVAGNELTFGHPSHRLDLVANACRFFKVQCLAGVFHPFDQLV
ncbi:hypothetical protein D3C72_1325860 [compost metagenome]